MTPFRKVTWLWLAIFGASTAAFVAISLLMVNGAFEQLNLHVYAGITNSPDSVAFYFSRVIADLYYILLPFLVFLAWWFYRQGRKIEAGLVLATVLGWVFDELVLKPFFHVTCPPQYFANIRNDLGIFQFSWARYFGSHGTCYPSGHTSSYTVFFGYLAFLSWRELKGWIKNVAVTFNLLVVATVGLTRLILHVHWFADVVGGYAIGLAMLALLIAANLYFTE